jgi:hypothetical protein
MATFLNKKEQVWDLQLTTYGRYLLSLGNFKPASYSFYDNNVIYDNRYTEGTTTETQNDVHNRIKNETQYLSSMTLFASVEETSKTEMGGVVDLSNLKNVAAKSRPRENIFKFDGAIGDAYLDGDANQAPSWKIVTLQSTISGSATKDITNNQNIPQIDIDARYVKKIKKTAPNFDPDGARSINLTTPNFKDNRVIVLEQNDPVIYIEEVNTQILTENFEMEVFEVLTSPNGSETLIRKYFESFEPQIKDGIMLSPTPQKNQIQTLTTGAVEYYFDLLSDKDIDQQLACQAVQTVNKQSYYVNLDFECGDTTDDSLYYDIYGSVTEPDICP